MNWLLAFMLAAQLCSVAHATEFGSGPHSHGEIACHHSVANDDDPGVVRHIGFLQTWLTDEVVVYPIPDHATANFTALPPPSTGPPSVS